MNDYKPEKALSYANILRAETGVAKSPEERDKLIQIAQGIVKNLQDFMEKVDKSNLAQ